MKSAQPVVHESPPTTPTLASSVKAAFVLRSTSLAAWCRANQIDPSWASQCLSGKRTGPKARAMRDRVVEAAGLK